MLKICRGSAELHISYINKYQPPTHTIHTNQPPNFHSCVAPSGIGVIYSTSSIIRVPADKCISIVSRVLSSSPRIVNARSTWPDDTASLPAVLLAAQLSCETEEWMPTLCPAIKNSAVRCWTWKSQWNTRDYRRYNRSNDSNIKCWRKNGALTLLASLGLLTRGISFLSWNFIGWFQTFIAAEWITWPQPTQPTRCDNR